MGWRGSVVTRSKRALPFFKPDVVIGVDVRRSAIIFANLLIRLGVQKGAAESSYWLFLLLCVPLETRALTSQTAL